jgi:hypothetical protein
MKAPGTTPGEDKSLNFVIKGRLGSLAVRSAYFSGYGLFKGVGVFLDYRIREAVCLDIRIGWGLCLEHLEGGLCLDNRMRGCGGNLIILGHKLVRSRRISQLGIDVFPKMNIK